MLDLNKIKRQIEIVGLCIADNAVLKPVDLAVMYNCEELTIKRDLQELRSYRIPIHSTKRKGVSLDQHLDAAKIKQLIVQYIGIANSQRAYDRATNLVVNKLKERSLSILVTLQRCIENTRAVVIDYVKESNEEEVGKEIFPLQIFQSDGYWRVLALHEGKIKQYHITKLKNVKQTERRFKRPPQEEIDNMFRYSFKSWVGSDTFHIRLQLSEPWISRIKPTQLFESQKMTEHNNGTAILKATVNSLTEVASWVVSRGAGVKVIEPLQLRKQVIDMATGALKNYEDQ
jgi:predicted DNA-binding transcriptional regulator YafY